MLAPVAAGAAASRRTLSSVVVVHTVAPVGDGRAYVIAPVGVQLEQVRGVPVSCWLLPVLLLLEQPSTSARVPAVKRASVRLRSRLRVALAVRAVIARDYPNP